MAVGTFDVRVDGRYAFARAWRDAWALGGDFGAGICRIVCNAITRLLDAGENVDAAIDCVYRRCQLCVVLLERLQGAQDLLQESCGIW